MADILALYDVDDIFSQVAGSVQEQVISSHPVAVAETVDSP